MEDGGMSEYDYVMMQSEMEMGRPGMYNEYSLPGYMQGAGTAEKKYSGFVVQALCYSPYGRTVTEVGELVDPDGVDDEPDKWGFITRLKHLDDMVEDPNDNPFELFKKEDHEQFNWDIKEVTVDDTPGGIGAWEEIIDETETAQIGSRSAPRSASMTRNWILIDPMTKETISKESVLNEEGKPVLSQGKPLYKVNDHWFVLNAKFIWRDAPKPPEKPKPTGYGRYGATSSQRPSTTTSTSTSSRSSGKSLPADIE